MLLHRQNAGEQRRQGQPSEYPPRGRAIARIPSANIKQQDSRRKEHDRINRHLGTNRPRRGQYLGQQEEQRQHE